MIDKFHLESAGNVVITSDEVHPMLAQWALAGKKSGTHIWVQISHAGRQTSRFVNLHPKSASDVQLKKMGVFGKPKPMTAEDINDVISGFVRASKVCKKAGFDGIQIHAAHGYLISQFLSPFTNLRKDKWGGSLENRSRLLLSIVHEVRKVVGPSFPISVKINSADFQRGGFTENESLDVIKMLEAAGIDLLEISGGTYEKVVFFTGEEVKESTREREAYFLDFAAKVRDTCSIPLMVTGGFRSYSFTSKALENGELDIVGMARPFITNIHEIRSFIYGKVSKLTDMAVRTGLKKLDDSVEGGFYARNIIRLARGKDVNLNYSPMSNALFLIKHEMIKGIRRKLYRS